MGKDTKIELRKIHHHKGISEETNAFDAEVWVDGRKAGFASNRGHGDPVLVHYDSPIWEQKVDAFIKTLPEKEGKVGSKSFKYKEDEDSYFSTLVSEDLRLRELKRNINKLKRQTKDGVVFREKGQKPGGYFVQKRTTIEEVKAKNPKVTAYCDHNNPEPFLRLICPALFESYLG